FPLLDGTPDEWQVLLRLGATVSGQGSDADLHALDDGVFGITVGSAVGNPQSSIYGRDPEEIFSATTGDGEELLRGPERILDFLVRSGPYGDGYGADPEGLTLERLKEAPHGIDLGPLHSRLPGDLCTPSGKVELAPEYLLSDVARLRESAARVPNGGFLLIGRRHIRSNNSWMHNIDVLVKGKERCTLQISDEDAQRLGLSGDARVKVSSAAGTLTVPVEVTDSIMPGVVSLPHGWGHDLEGSALSVAAERPGVNTNRLSTGAMDPVSGNAILNGIPVEVVPV
ncbi:MAG: molybdopterin dinucleotide binding domain-containing protein, partial [Acidimicrobiia bacterium]